jgi:hypothetical protein
MTSWNYSLIAYVHTAHGYPSCRRRGSRPISFVRSSESTSRTSLPSWSYRLVIEIVRGTYISADRWKQISCCHEHSQMYLSILCPQTVELWVPMCCDKCERKVREHLEDMEGKNIHVIFCPPHEYHLNVCCHSLKFRPHLTWSAIFFGAKLRIYTSHFFFCDYCKKIIIWFSSSQHS